MSFSATAHAIPNVVAAPYNTLVVAFARVHGRRRIIKGVRAISDFEYELEMHQLNRKQAPELESVYLMASAEYSLFRSSGVKELATLGGKLDSMAPASVITRCTRERTHASFGSVRVSWRRHARRPRRC